MIAISFTNPSKSIVTSHTASSLYSHRTYTSDALPEAIYDIIAQFIREQQMDFPNHPALVNMLDNTEPGFLSIVKQRTRWYKGAGEITLLFHKNQLVGISCVEQADMHPDLSVGGIRCWIHRDHRTQRQASTYLLKSNLEWSQRAGKAGMLLTFNDYNKKIYSAIKRKTQGGAVSFGGIWSDWWDDCLVMPAPLLIRYTPQWCILKPIDYTRANIIYKTLCEAVR